ncbi:hypothetical protein BDV28DRAFT_143789 [Aspergillus coremiiformis]|uniref:Uncharacterized protein n=1 Tax=Aspergillus coremiiformis TaxID=138285 RepID=A0A5N6YXB7_9EURO|nr:hypothetical protein BDV28DRAFT_143789 [Aspergillus coremiiformis]
MFPPTKDEQIVNTALVVFLNALTIHFDICQTCNWTMHRKGFIAKFEETSFEARTDGYLDDGNENAYALIEVKPVVRGEKENRIQMQESAQMVGWLMNNADMDIYDKLGIHMSQNRHEIFLTFADYDDDYLAYLQNKPPKKSALSFLKMHQYGPWNTQSASDMKQLGPILLAITLYAYTEIQAKQKPRQR